MNKILLIFCGGTKLFQKKGSFLLVEKKSDIKTWLKAVPEISFMSQIETLFIDQANKILNKNNIQKLITHIKNNLNKFNGIVILHDVDGIPLLANQLFWQIQNLNKPIVITGSNVIEEANKFMPDLSFKANLINAFQVVNSNINEVSVIYGDRVIWAPKIVRTKLQDLNIFKSIDKEYLARVDFGLSIKYKEKKKSKIKYYHNFDYNFLFFNNVPDLNSLELLLAKNTVLKIIVFRAFPNQIIEREKLVKVFSLAQKNKKLIIFYSQIGFAKDFFQNTILTISKISPECLSAKLSWILGQTKEDIKIRELLKKNIQGEFLKL